MIIARFLITYIFIGGLSLLAGNYDSTNCLLVTFVAIWLVEAERKEQG